LEFFNKIGSPDTFAALVMSGGFGNHALSMHGGRTGSVRDEVSFRCKCINVCFDWIR
jgi:hypothetical protein